MAVGITQHTGKQTRDRIEPSNGRNLPTRQDEVTQTPLQIYKAVDKTLVYSLVASAHQDHPSRRRGMRRNARMRDRFALRRKQHDRRLHCLRLSTVSTNRAQRVR